MMDVLTKKLPICVLLYAFQTLGEPIHLLVDPSSPNYRFRAQRLVCTQLPSEID